MKIIRISLLHEELRKLWGAPTATLIKTLLQKGWKTHPEIMVVTPFGFFSGIAILYIRATSEVYKQPPKFFREITIYRPDDPRVSQIRKDDSCMLDRLR